jgi:hypothetical protein
MNRLNVTIVITNRGKDNMNYANLTPSAKNVWLESRIQMLDYFMDVSQHTKDSDVWTALFAGAKQNLKMQLSLLEEEKKQ